ncbi:MAG: hypothetical protein AB9903_14710 [Vulcanimicrobiota bacterium]
MFITGLLNEKDVAEDRKIGSRYYLEKLFDRSTLPALPDNVQKQND